MTQLARTSPLTVRQLFDHDTFTYTYLLMDPETREGTLIDSVKEQVERDLKLIQELGISLKYILETHVHADHITGADDIRNMTGARTVVGAASSVACADVLIQDQEELKLGHHKIKALSTPGHTSGCTSYFTEGMVFSGDTLLIRGTGRSDFQQGDAATLYESITQKLFTLPEETIVYPGHDYKGLTCSSIGEEKQNNPRIGRGRSKSEFIQIMNNLNLAHPKKIHEALPANMKCGNTGLSGNIIQKQ